MATKQQEKPLDEPEKPARQLPNAMIGKGVLQILGQPENLISLQVRHLWDGRYRVNVLVGVDIVSAKVANSYFLVTDDNGKILSSMPKITRQYSPVGEGGSKL